MLSTTVSDFLAYCKTCNFGVRSLEVFTSVLNKFTEHLTSINIASIQIVTYPHLLSFIIADNPSVHTKKQRIWTLHQLFHYLELQKIINKNIAMKLPYPKIDKKEPDFLTVKELKTIINYFVSSANSENGMRNFNFVEFRL